MSNKMETERNWFIGLVGFISITALVFYSYKWSFVNDCKDFTNDWGTEAQIDKIMNMKTPVWRCVIGIALAIITLFSLASLFLGENNGNSHLIGKFQTVFWLCVVTVGVNIIDLIVDYSDMNRAEDLYDKAIKTLNRSDSRDVIADMLSDFKDLGSKISSINFIAYATIASTISIVGVWGLKAVFITEFKNNQSITYIE